MSDVRVGSVDDLEVGAVMAVTVEGVEIALARTEEGFFAVRDKCTHGAVKLSEGEVDGCELECWLHGATFDLRTGKPSGLPAVTPVAVYPVTVVGDDVFVSLTAAGPSH